MFFSTANRRLLLLKPAILKGFSTAPPPPPPKTSKVVECVLLSKVQVNHDSYIYKFNFKDPNATLELPYGQHIKMMADLKTPESPNVPVPVSRRYTPISDVSEIRSIDLLLKIYRKTTKFPFGGLMTQYLESLNIGDSLKISGPEGKLRYKAQGELFIGPDLRKIKRLGLIAGGSGITPMYQMIKAVVNDPNDKTEVTLLFANKTEEDILLRKEIGELQKKRSFVWKNTLEVVPKGWTDYQGFITKEMLQTLFPNPSPDTLICLCGPQPMNRMVIENLTAMGYGSASLFKF